MTDEVQEPDTIELEQRAQLAREQLMTSLARLDRRAKHIVHQATDASLASGLALAAAVSFWLSMVIAPKPQRALPANIRGHVVPPPRRSFVSIALRTAAFAAGLAFTGWCVRAAERHARNLNAGHGVAPVARRSASVMHESRL
jgi:hypothetical protein